MDIVARPFRNDEDRRGKLNKSLEKLLAVIRVYRHKIVTHLDK